jgi:UDP-2,3-diacylglucosamine hydrolase
MNENKKLALIAGYGELPAAMIESALNQGIDITAILLTDKNYDIIRKLLPSEKIFRVNPVQISKILELIKRLDISELTFLGKVPKLEFFRHLSKLDLDVLKRVQSLENTNDDSLHALVVQIVEEHGLKVADQTKYLKKYFPDEQIFTLRSPSDKELEEIKFGLKTAKSMAALDIGQSVLVRNGSIIAVEAIEGTDLCIRRSKKLFSALNFLLGKKQGPLILCKSSKPNQDKRFDVPTLGLKTLKHLGPDSIVAIEANEVLFLDQKESIDYANKKNISIISLKF